LAAFPMHFSTEVGLAFCDYFHRVHGIEPSTLKQIAYTRLESVSCRDGRVRYRRVR
jgi:hypothetical protein